MHEAPSRERQDFDPLHAASLYKEYILCFLHWDGVYAKHHLSYKNRLFSSQYLVYCWPSSSEIFEPQS